MNPQSTPVAPGDEERQYEVVRDNIRSGVALSSGETVNRYGSANAEYIKGYTGVDNETGEIYAKGLKDVAKHKVNPDFTDQNIKQQAGFSAEIAATSRDNAEAIIAGSKVRTSRTDDVPQFGSNHPVVDRVQILDGVIIEGSQSQMKFVGNRDQLLKDIAKVNGKFSRYRGVKIELPSEQYEGAAQHCRDQAKQLRFNADQVEKRGNHDLAARLRLEANNYEQLAENVRDSGMTTEQAIFYRKHPGIATAFDVARTSHRAGVEGAKFGAAIGGAISLFQNFIALASEEKNLPEAASDIALDIAKSAALGYGTAFFGAALKGGLQQSSQAGLRALAGTNAPVLAVNACFSLGGSIKRFVTGEITEYQLLVEVGEKGSGMLSSGMFATLGQMAIPIPFVGAAVGGMVGYTLSSIFYQCARDAARGAEASGVKLEHVRAIESAARARLAEEQVALDNLVSREIPELHAQSRQLFEVIATTDADQVDALAAAINEYALLLGQRLQFRSKAEFEEFMQTGEPLRL